MGGFDLIPKEAVIKSVEEIKEKQEGLGKSLTEQCIKLGLQASIDIIKKNCGV